MASDKVRLMKMHIWKKLLEGNGLVPTDQELDMHAVLSLAYRQVDAEELAALYAWADKLVLHFAALAAFDQEQLLEIVTAKLFDVSNDSAALGPVAFAAFQRWLRFSGQRFSVSRRLRFMVKSAVRYGKYAYHS